MNVPNLMSKAFSYQDLRSGGHYVRPPLPPSSPRAWSDKNTPGQIGLKPNFENKVWYDFINKKFSFPLLIECKNFKNF